MDEYKFRSNKTEKIRSKKYNKKRKQTRPLNNSPPRVDSTSSDHVICHCPECTREYEEKQNYELRKFLSDQAEERWERFVGGMND